MGSRRKRKKLRRERRKALKNERRDRQRSVGDGGSRCEAPVSVGCGALAILKEIFPPQLWLSHMHLCGIIVFNYPESREVSVSSAEESIILHCGKGTSSQEASLALIAGVAGLLGVRVAVDDLTSGRLASALHPRLRRDILEVIAGRGRVFRSRLGSIDARGSVNGHGVPFEVSDPDLPTQIIVELVRPSGKVQHVGFLPDIASPVVQFSINGQEFHHPFEIIEGLPDDLGHCSQCCANGNCDG